LQSTVHSKKTKYKSKALLSYLKILSLYMDIYVETRPWGRFEKFNENQLCTVKLIYINEGSRLSLQYHRQRWEQWKIIKGTTEIQIDEEILVVKQGQTVVIPKNAKHRIKALRGNSIVLEISYGKFDENDIVRLEDDYQRESPSSGHAIS
jgi:mannose-6-phosphate isomerase